MKKGLIIGMAGLTIGSAILGGVCGHFLTKRPDNAKPDNPGVVTEDKYNDFEIPSDLCNLTFTIYDFDKLSIFSASNGSSYVLHKDTKKFDFLYADKFYSSMKLDDKRYILYSSSYLYVFNIEQCSIDRIDLGSSADNLGFIQGTSDDTFFVHCYIAGIYKLFKFDKNSLEYQSFTINSSVSYADFVYEYENKFLLMRRSDSTSYNAYVLNSETGDIKTISGVYFSSVGSSSRQPIAIQRENKLYTIVKYSGTEKLAIFDFDTENFSYTDFNSYSYSCSYKVLDNGIYFYFSSTNYNSGFLDFSDDSIAVIGKFASVFEIDDKLYFSNIVSVSSGSSSKYVKLYTFDETTKELKEVFSTSELSSPAAFGFIKFNGENYIYTSVGSGNPSYYNYKFTKDENGSPIFSLVSMKSLISNSHYFKIADDEYLFWGNNLNYYNFKTDIYNKLWSGVTNCEVSKVGDIVEIRCNGYIYNFNPKLCSLTTVGYYEENV